MKTKRKIFNLRAESLIETIVAVTIIAIGATGAMIIVRTSLLGNEISEDRIAALNLAQEGVEAIQNIRDTNWLRYDAARDECWNSIAGTSISNCGDNLIADGGNYALVLDTETLEYSLDNIGDNNVFNDDYRLWECEFENASTTGSGTLFAIPTNATNCTESNFYRYINTVYDPTEPDDILTVTAHVGWKIAGEEKEVSLQQDIANW